MTINEREKILVEYEKTIDYVFNIKPEDFYAFLETTEYVPKEETNIWMSYMTSFKDYKRGLGVANGHHKRQEENLRNVTKEHISSSLMLAKTLFSSLNNVYTEVRDMDKMLYGQEYSLYHTFPEDDTIFNHPTIIVNQILIAVYSLLSLQTVVRGEKDLDASKFLLEALSSERFGFDCTVHILTSYMKELIKTINDKNYNSPIIDILKQGIDEKEKIVAVNQEDTSKVNEIMSFTDCEKKSLIEGLNSQTHDARTKIYKRVTDEMYDSFNSFI